MAELGEATSGCRSNGSHEEIQRHTAFHLHAVWTQSEFSSTSPAIGIVTLHVVERLQIQERECPVVNGQYNFEHPYSCMHHGVRSTVLVLYKHRSDRCNIWPIPNLNKHLHKASVFGCSSGCNLARGTAKIAKVQRKSWQYVSVRTCLELEGIQQCTCW